MKRLFLLIFTLCTLMLHAQSSQQTVYINAAFKGGFVYYDGQAWYYYDDENGKYHSKYIHSSDDENWWYAVGTVARIAVPKKVGGKYFFKDSKHTEWTEMASACTSITYTKNWRHDPYKGEQQTTINVRYSNGRFYYDGSLWLEYRNDKTNVHNRFLNYDNDDDYWYIMNGQCRVALPRKTNGKFFLKMKDTDKWTEMYSACTDIAYGKTNGGNQNNNVSQGTRPELAWLNFQPSTTDKQYSFKVGVKSKSQVTACSVTVNGVVERGINAVKNDGYDYSVHRTVALVEGTNRIKVEVTNATGTTVIEREVAYKPTVHNATTRERRIALVVGNSQYRDSDKRLNNPSNDATDLAQKLRKLGFNVTCAIDKTQQEMDQAITKFGRDAQNYDVAMFFFAGHGIQYHGENYLIPIDADLPDETAVKYKCVNSNLVLDVLDRAGCPMKIVVLDACRNNPFARSWNRGASSAGLSNMNAPKGTFIGFSTAPGDVASDGSGQRNSPYTSALLEVLDRPNLSLTDVFQEVLSIVANKTNERQIPWSTNSFLGKFVFNQQ